MTPKPENHITPWETRREAIDRIGQRVGDAIENKGMVSRVTCEEIEHALAIQPDHEDSTPVTGEPWLDDLLLVHSPVEIPRTDVEEIHDFIGRFENYADYYENWELICLAVGAAESFAMPLFTDPTLAWQDAEPAVRELALLCGKHKLTGVADSYGKPDGSTILHVGACIDCWCQATGIDVPNPTGVWEIRTGAEALGWKNPRRTRP